jgi:predicted phage terminase large subunit-like protein
MIETVTIRAEDALAERAKRELSRRKFIEYCTYVAPWYQRAEHIDLVAEYLEQVELFIRSKGKNGIGRLMILKPPRTSKTEECAKLFPSWLLGKQPDNQIIISSYAAELAQESSRAVRDYVESERYKAVFGERSILEAPVGLSDDSRSVGNWHLAAPHRGVVRAVGVGGGATGFGAHLFVLDDPFKNRDEADSEQNRKRVMSWWRSSALTRLEDGGAVLIIHTRWNPDDVAGQLIQAMVSDDPLADQYVILNLPAIAYADDEYPETESQQRELMLRGSYIPLGGEGDPLGRKAGEPIWPKKFTAKDYERTRANVGEFEWASLYQQQPRPASGGFFDEGDFEIVEQGTVPEGLRWYRYVDVALGRNKRSDFNTTLATGLDTITGDVYYRDGIKVRELNSFMAQTSVRMLSDLELGTEWGFEDVSFQSLVMQEFLKRPELAAILIRPVVPKGDKELRARLLQTRAKSGKVKLVRGPWVQDFINQCLLFPKGQHDDWIDSASGGLEMAAKPRYTRMTSVRA